MMRSMIFAVAAVLAVSTPALVNAQVQSELPSDAVRGTGSLESTWIGTAPFCAGSADDCVSAGLNFWLNNNYGDGAGCTTGNKVLCVNEPKSNFQNTLWVGTAPFCGAAPSDCPSGWSFVAYGTAGDGHSCATGTKVLCAQPN